MNCVYILLLLCICFILYSMKQSKPPKDIDLIEKYNTCSNDYESHSMLLSMIDNKKCKNITEEIFLPTIKADVVEVSVPTFKSKVAPYIVTVNNAIKHGKVKEINDDPKLPNLDTVLDRAERFIEDIMFPNEEEMQLQLAILESSRNKLHEQKVKETSTQEKYFKDIIIKSDPQNVHETTVNNGLKSKLKLIKEKNEQYPNEVPSMIVEASKHKDGNNIISVLQMNMLWDGESEQLLYDTMWKYVVNNDLVNSFFDAAADCYENGHMICTTGRVDRIISCVISCDKDEEVAKPVLSLDIIRKLALGKAYSILQEELDKRGDEFRKKYEEEDVPEFKEEVMKLVTEYVDTEFKDLTEKQRDDLLLEISYGI